MATVQELQALSLPAELRDLPSIQAEPWMCIDEAGVLDVVESPVFDREGNLYVCGCRRMNGGIILKIDPRGTINTFYDSPDASIAGAAFHKDGRLFGANFCGGVVVIRPDGTEEQRLETVFQGQQIYPDDLCFDLEGNLYITDYGGEPAPVAFEDNCYDDPHCGVYRLTAESGYSQIQLIAQGMSCANGVSISPAGDVLWTSDTAQNCLYRITLTEEHQPPTEAKLRGCSFNGAALADSNKIDSAGNIYQAFIFGGRLLVLDAWANPIANVLLEDRERTAHFATTNLTIKPGTDDAYISVRGEDKGWIYRFKALAPAQELFGYL